MRACKCQLFTGEGSRRLPKRLNYCFSVLASATNRSIWVFLATQVYIVLTLESLIQAQDMSIKVCILSVCIIYKSWLCGVYTTREPRPEEVCSAYTRNTPSSHDSYNIYTNRQVKAPFLPACGLKWRSAAFLGSSEISQRMPPWALLKWSAIILEDLAMFWPESKVKIGDLQSGVYKNTTSKLVVYAKYTTCVSIGKLCN